MKQPSLTLLSMIMLSAACLSTPSQAFTGFVAAPSATSQMNLDGNDKAHAQPVSLHREQSKLDRMERAPLTLHLGNRAHLFDGYLLCQTQPVDAPGAHFAGFSD